MPVYDPDGYSDVTAEEDFFPDDVAMVTKMLKDEWSPAWQHMPIISYDQQGLYADARSSYIFVYHVSGYNSISSTDYRSTQATTFLGIKVSCPFRNQLYNCIREIYRILLANRRARSRWSSTPPCRCRRNSPAANPRSNPARRS